MKPLVLLALLALGRLAMADDVALLRIKSGDGAPPQFVVIEFYEKAAPLTVDNFKKLAESKFYNGTAVHRIFPHQMIQAGDPLSRKKGRDDVGTGGPGYTLPPEINSHKNITGAVAMARLPDKLNPERRSNGSQFYVILTPIPSFDGSYTVFGQVIEGLEILDNISTKAADTNDARSNGSPLKASKSSPARPSPKQKRKRLEQG